MTQAQLAQGHGPLLAVRDVSVVFVPCVMVVRPGKVTVVCEIVLRFVTVEIGAVPKDVEVLVKVVVPVDWLTVVRKLVRVVSVVPVENDVVVRRVEFGSRPGRYNLFTFVADMLIDQDPLWAAEIIWIKQP